MDAFDQYADEITARARQAAEEFRGFDQARTDRIVDAVFTAAWEHRHALARLAFEETGLGVLDHKVLKNAYASLLVYEDIRRRPTVGVISSDPMLGITEVAQPKGPILATIPVTNPTSTTIFKALIALKTRNPVIFCPHRAAHRSIRETVRLLAEAAESAGAPAGALQVLKRVQSGQLERLMGHPRLALILATGTSAIVRLAQASGTPTIGVGPGNVPVYVHESADLPFAARSIVFSKSFDNSTVCGSEQALVVEPAVDRALRPLLEAAGVHFCDARQAAALGEACFDADLRRMRADVVGQPATAVAARAGFDVPPSTLVLAAEQTGVGPEFPLSYEILAPVLAYYRVADYAEALATCSALNLWGGVGHTVAVYTNDDRVVDDFGRMNAARILVNHPTTQGAIGGIFNTLRPSLTLACGTGAGNLSTDNISTDHLLNIHRIARRRVNHQWLDEARARSLDPAVSAAEILRTYHRNH
jgi:acetaldehyde dehydrogenase/alcohol dehydrogenase